MGDNERESRNPNWDKLVGVGRPRQELGTGTAVNETAVEWRKQELIRLLLEGKTMKQAAMIIGVAPTTVTTYAKDPVWRDQVRQLSSSLLGRLDDEIIDALRTKTQIVDDLAFKALKEMERMLDDQNLHPGIKAKLIDSALDRTPELSRTKKLDVTSKTLTLKGEDLLAAAAAAREVDDYQRTTEEAPPEEVKE